ncbi:MAG TPA: DUF6476 family protein [Acetobacteraceae bacterium]|nr:DUF6476 family protein [Acetobacteraceae bacterium]
MRMLKFVTVAMAVLIVLGTTVIVVTIIRRTSAPAATSPMALMLDEPAGTHIMGVAAAGDRLAVRLEGGGPDRVMLIDPHAGTVAGRISLIR